MRYIIIIMLILLALTGSAIIGSGAMLSKSRQEFIARCARAGGYAIDTSRGGVCLAQPPPLVERGETR